LPQIHPTAIVDKQAELADDVEIGPHCVISGPVVIGSGCRLIGNVYLQNRVTLGQHNTLYPFACIGFDPQDRKFDGRPSGVQIGDNNILRECVTIHRSMSTDRPTTIGHSNMLMNNVHIGHDVTIGHHCTLVSGALVGGHATLQDQAYVGGNAAVHQFCTMGRLSLIGGLRGAIKDLPPFTICAGYNNVIGINLVGLRRAGMSNDAIGQVKKAFQILYLSKHTNPVAAGLIEEEAAKQGPGADLLMEMARFVRHSTRGLCPYIASE